MEFLNNFLYAIFPRSSIAEMQFLYKTLRFIWQQLSCCDTWHLWIRLNRWILYNTARTINNLFWSWIVTRFYKSPSVHGKFLLMNMVVAYGKGGAMLSATPFMLQPWHQMWFSYSYISHMHITLQSLQNMRMREDIDVFKQLRLDI